ncbi:MAG: hypothetical protein IKI75_08490 [Lachnospiraceae bacterium]|nr:hypothetical protein [Lachnospiraceae bacterium]
MAVDLNDGLYRINLNFLKKERYSGSSDGMRFMLMKHSAEGEEDRLELVIWPEPLCFEKTADEDKHSYFYSFDKEGLDAAVEKLNDMFKEGV